MELPFFEMRKTVENRSGESYELSVVQTRFEAPAGNSDGDADEAMT